MTLNNYGAQKKKNLDRQTTRFNSKNFQTEEGLVKLENMTHRGMTIFYLYYGFELRQMSR